jgi:hypothetical protein
MSERALGTVQKALFWVAEPRVAPFDHYAKSLRGSQDLA